jgi:broad specificity phosphatase PhoE
MNSQMLELVLARHGESYGNLDRAMGSDTELTALGRWQATRLGNWLAEQDYAFRALYSSPYLRARQTAEIVSIRLGLKVMVDPDLRETEISLEDSLPRRQRPLELEPPVPFTEEYQELYERIKRATARILDENREGQVLVVAHGGSVGTMVRCILGTHPLLVHTDLAAVHCLCWRDHRWDMVYMNRQEYLLAGDG